MSSNLPKRVLILRNHLLMNAGLQSLLSGQESLEVIGKNARDQEELIRLIDHIQPDVIIVDEDFLFPNLAELLRSLQRYPKKRTIILSLEENQIYVYDTMQIQLRQLSDFLAVLWLFVSSTSAELIISNLGKEELENLVERNLNIKTCSKFRETDHILF